ncbi:MAG: S8 family serine peptidase [Pseudomonadota bacterium]
MNRPLALFLVVVLLVALWMLRSPPVAEVGLEGAAGPLAEHSPGVLVVDFADGTTEEHIREVATRTGIPLAYSSAVSEDEALTSAEVGDVAAALALLAAEPGIEVAAPAVTMQALGYPDDPRWGEQWNMRLVGAPVGWRVGAGRGVTVAVIDTGVSPVSDLDGVDLRAGMSFVPGVSTAADDQGHGTHVAGTIAQATHNGLGVAGLAPRVTLVPYKVLGADGSGRDDHIAAAVDQAVDDGVDVINLSLGGGHSEVLHLAVQKAAAAGVVVVAAAGNSGREGVSCPGHAVGVLGVGSVGPESTIAPYSSWGEGLDLVGPGGDTTMEGGGVLQQTLDDQLAAWQGTSMASPHVAGAAAVLLGAGAGGPERVKSLLLGSTVDLGEPGYDTHYGYGLLDLAAAVRRVQLRGFGVAFAIAGLLGLLSTTMIQARGGARAVAIVTAALVAGGLFFLPLLPLSPSLGSSLASRGLLYWPGALLGWEWSHFPLWASALLPLAAVVLLGPTRLWPLALGLTLGFAVALLQAAALGQIEPWWLGGLGPAWLVVNGLLALAAGLAIAGLHRARATGRL